MDNHELVKGLEKWKTLDAQSEEHRTKLKQALIEKHGSIAEKRKRIFGSGLVGKRLVVTMGMGMAIAVMAFVLNLAPNTPRSPADEGRVIAAVMESPEIKAALMGEEIAGVRVSGALNYTASANITTSSGRTYIALVNQQGQVVAINPGENQLGYGFFPLINTDGFDSYYESESPFALTLDEKQQVLDIARGNQLTRGLFDQGGVILKYSIAFVKTTTTFDLESRTWSATIHEKLAQILIQLGDQQILWFIDPGIGKVFSTLEEFCRDRGILSPAEMKQIGTSQISPIDLRPSETTR